MAKNKRASPYTDVLFRYITNYYALTDVFSSLTLREFNTAQGNSNSVLAHTLRNLEERKLIIRTLETTQAAHGGKLIPTFRRNRPTLWGKHQGVELLTAMDTTFKIHATHILEALAANPRHC